MKIENLNENNLLLVIVIGLLILYVYSLNYEYTSVKSVDIRELKNAQNGDLVKITGIAQVGNRTVICTDACVFLNYYTGKSGVATVIGTVRKNNYTVVNVLKTYQ